MKKKTKMSEAEKLAQRQDDERKARGSNDNRGGTPAAKRAGAEALYAFKSAIEKIPHLKLEIDTSVGYQTKSDAVIVNERDDKRTKIEFKKLSTDGCIGVSPGFEKTCDLVVVGEKLVGAPCDYKFYTLPFRFIHEVMVSAPFYNTDTDRPDNVRRRKVKVKREWLKDLNI